VTVDLRGTVVTPQSADPATGYSVDAALVVEQDFDGELLRVPVGGSARVGEDSGWAIHIEVEGDGAPVGSVELTVSAPDGSRVTSLRVSVAQIVKPIAIPITPAEVPGFDAAGEPTTGQRPLLTGRVVDAGGRETPARLPVAIWAGASGDGDADLHPVAVTATQPGGFFTAPWPVDAFGRAEGRVDGVDAVNVRLEPGGQLPRDILLVLDLGELPVDAECACAETPPRAPEPADLVRNPAAFSQDLGAGCVDLTAPNRTVEEFLYRFVVRTSEPRVKALTLGARRKVPRDLLSDLLGASMVSEVLAPRSRAAARPATTPLSLDVRSAKRLVRGDRPPALAAVSRASWLSEVDGVKELIDAGLREQTGRTILDADHGIDWDDTPTIHQPIELAHGHVLHMREVWRPDGYSLGDLLYSLPLAPLQRRRIAVVDWERRSVSERTEALEFEEELDAFLSRDRDVREIVGTHLREDTAGGSRSTTWGAAGGIGAGFITGGFGIFGGVAGGYASSSATAWQRSSRDFSASSLQRLQDRVSQRSSALRDERSTVIQTVAQGRRCARRPRWWPTTTTATPLRSSTSRCCGTSWSVTSWPTSPSACSCRSRSSRSTAARRCAGGSRWPATCVTGACARASRPSVASPTTGSAGTTPRRASARRRPRASRASSESPSCFRARAMPRTAPSSTRSGCPIAISSAST
jgi:hypothetical protein